MEEEIVFTPALETPGTYYIFRSVHEQVEMTVVNNYLKPNTTLLPIEKEYLKKNYPHWRWAS